jgi:hypothetical protein
MDINGFRVGYCIYADGEIAKIVSIDSENDIVEVITQQDIILMIHPYETNIKPIPITQDILAHCGFNEHGILYFDINGLIFSFKFNKDHIILCDRFVHPLIYFWEVKYLHLLQRLYWGLTGKRLDISLINVPPK